MNINWTVRFKNHVFWLTVIPAIFLFIQTIAGALGIDLDLTEAQQVCLQIVDTVFAALAVLGVVVDGTTYGIGDSARALTYEKPHKD